MENVEEVHTSPELGTLNFNEIPERDNPHGKSKRVDKLLCPDHPLLQKFQESLRQHLLRAKEQLTSDIEEISFSTKKAKMEREEFGERLYDLQQEILRQNDILDGYAREMSETSEKRKEFELKMAPVKTEFEEKTTVLKDAKERYNKRMVELGNLQNLESHIQKWTQEIEDEVVAAKRTVSKDAQLQQALAEEKKKSDFMLFSLDVEVRERERELELITSQAREQAANIDTLQSSLSDASADLEVIQQEHKRLTQAWGEVIIAIQHRDKILYQSKADLQKSEEHFKLTVFSIQATKKQISKEMEQSQKLEAFKQRLEEDLRNLKRQAETEADILSKLEQKMEEIPLLIEQTEKDFTEARKEGNALELSLRSLQVKIDKQAMKKLQIEDAILKLAQDQLLADKASQYRMKLLRDSQDQRRSMELNLSQSESSLATTLFNLERFKGTMLKVREENQAIAKRYAEANSEAAQLTDELKVLENDIKLKIKVIDKLTKRMDKLLRATEGVEISPTDQKIKILESSIDLTEQQIKDAQQFWLILQGHIVGINEKRNIQLNEYEIAQNELLIISQKSLKIDNELEDIEKAGSGINREIQQLSTQLDLLGAKLFQERKTHEIEENDCQLRHFELLEQLKQKEMGILQAEEDILNTTKELETLKDKVLQQHREALSWESKYKLTEETIRWRRGERAIESEIGHMKAEIHRMEIRHSQLKRAQEKLIQDLEHSVMHREQIFVGAVFRHKREGCQTRTRTSIQQKLHDAKAKLKHTQSELALHQANLNNLQTEREELKQEIERKEQELLAEQEQLRLVQAEIEQGILLKYQNLDNIVRKQRRAKSYRRLIGSNVKEKMSRSEMSIEISLQRQKDMNTSLACVIQHLIQEYPEKFLLKRIFQTLQDDK